MSISWYTSEPFGDPYRCLKLNLDVRILFFEPDIEQDAMHKLLLTKEETEFKWNDFAQPEIRL